MVMKSIDTRFALGSEQDLTVPTSTQKYPLGMIYECEDSDTKTIKKYMYIYGGSGKTVAVPYMITWSTTSGQEVGATTPATFAAPGRLIGVPPATIASAYYGFVQIEGHCEAALPICTAGYFLNIENTDAVFSVDGTTTMDDESVGIAVDTCASATTATCYLFNRRAVISAD